MSEIINANEIMQSVGGAYAELESYQDKGYVETTFKPGTDAERVTKLTFETNFMRPNLFRFDWKDRLLEDSEERHHIIWCDGKAAYWKYPDQGKRRIKMPFVFPNTTRDLGFVIAAATGVSSGVAQTVSALLMPQLNGRRLSDLKDLELVGDREVKGESCYLIKHNDRDRINDETIIWISKSRFIVRKIEEDYVVGGSSDDGEQDETPTRAPFWSPRRYLEPLIEWLLLRQFGLTQSNMSEVPRRRKFKEFSVRRATFYETVEINQRVPKETFKGWIE